MTIGGLNMIRGKDLVLSTLHSLVPGRGPGCSRDVRRKGRDEIPFHCMESKRSSHKGYWSEKAEVVRRGHLDFIF
jgi:hypothetical protein